MIFVVDFLAWLGFYVSHIMITSKVQVLSKREYKLLPFNTCLLNTGHIVTRPNDLSRLDIKRKTIYLYIYNYFIN